MRQHKGDFYLALVLFLAMFFIPFLALGRPAAGKSGPGPSGASPASVPAPSRDAGSGGGGTAPDSFRILDTGTKQVLTVEDLDFVRGSVASELSPQAETEALKAQAVACYTYYSRLREARRKTPDPSLSGADFSADLKSGQAYLTEELRKERWGSRYDEYAKILAGAVDQVFGQVLRSDGKLIEATFYAISSGNTEASADVWGGERPYLISVASPGDRFAGGFQTTVVLPQDKMKACILSAAPGADLSGDVSGWIGTAERTAAGSVKTIPLGGKNVTGNDARGAFGLRAANFTVSYSGGNFTFVVRGYGHNVGMSQAGAQYMARQGADYRQILSWYYPNTALGSL